MIRAGKGEQVVAQIDACVLARALRRTLALSLVYVKMCASMWSTSILEKMQSAISKISKGDANIVRQRTEIVEKFPISMISDIGHLQGELKLPDPNDRHVLAAAIARGVECIATDYLKDISQTRYIPICQYISP